MKRGKSLKALLMLSVLTLTIALSGCSGDKKGNESGSTPSSQEPDNNSQSTALNGGRIVVGIPQDLEDSLDPHIAVAAGTKEILFNIFEGLVKPDTEGNLVPAVASDVDISSDGKVYTFTLRENVKFHNGQPVTAEDVKYSIDRCADSSDGEPLISAYSIIDSVNIVDENMVEIVLKEENTEFLAYMTTAILPKDYTGQDLSPVGTGPFSYVSRSPQENIILERFEDYWGEPAYLDEVEFKIIADADTIVMNLKSGAIDMFSRLTSSQAAEAEEICNIYEGTMNLVQALYLNNEREPFNKKEVRQALCYGVNRQDILDLAFDGQGTIIGSSMFPAFGKYYVEELSQVYTPDPERARQLLADAGYPNGFAMTITVPSNYQPHMDTAEVIAEQLKEIGIAVTIQPIEWGSWLSDVYSDRDFQATVVGVDASALTARALLERFTSTAGGNFVNYSNPEYDRLFEAVVSCTDDGEQVSLYKEMEQLLTEDAANVYIQDLANLVALNKNFAGYEFYPLYVLDMSMIYRVK